MKDPLKISRFTKIAVALLVLFWIATPVMRIWWGHVADQKLQAEIAAVAARGETLNIKELVSPPIPDEVNAAEMYLKAVAALNLGKIEDNSSFEPHFRPPSQPSFYEQFALWSSSDEQRNKDKAEIQKLLEDNTKALALTHKANLMKQCRWNLDYDGPLLGLKLPPIGQMRDLARLFYLSALVSHDAGDDADALTSIQDILAISRASRQCPFLIANLVGNSCDSLACEAIERIAPNLKMNDQSRPVAQNLIAELSNSKTVIDSLVLTMSGERCSQYDTCERFREGSIGDDFQTKRIDWKRATFSVAPMLILDEARIVNRAGVDVAAAHAENYPASLAMQPIPQESKRSLKSISRLLSELLTPVMNRIYVLHFRAIAMRQMAATAMAIRLYELDNNKRPAKLDDLSGKYMPALPKDPFCPSGGILLYSPDAAKPLLYSVGENGKDDGGAYNVMSDGAFDKDGSNDCVFFLNGNRPYPSPEQLKAISGPHPNMPPGLRDIMPATEPSDTTLPANPAAEKSQAEQPPMPTEAELR